MVVTVAIPWWLLAIPLALIALLALVVLRLYGADRRLVGGNGHDSDATWGMIAAGVIVVGVLWFFLSAR